MYLLQAPHNAFWKVFFTIESLFYDFLNLGANGVVNLKLVLKSLHFLIAQDFLNIIICTELLDLISDLYSTISVNICLWQYLWFSHVKARNSSLLVYPVMSKKMHFLMDVSQTLCIRKKWCEGSLSLEANREGLWAATLRPSRTFLLWRSCHKSQWMPFKYQDT